MLYLQPKSSPEKEQEGFMLTPRVGVSNFTAAERKFKKTPRIEVRGPRLN